MVLALFGVLWMVMFSSGTNASQTPSSALLAFGLLHHAKQVATTTDTDAEVSVQNNVLTLSCGGTAIVVPSTDTGVFKINGQGKLGYKALRTAKFAGTLFKNDRSLLSEDVGDGHLRLKTYVGP